MNVAEIFIESLLKEPLLHGDEKHRAWLSEELRSRQSYLEQLIDEHARLERAVALREVAANTDPTQLRRLLKRVMADELGIDESKNTQDGGYSAETILSYILPQIDVWLHDNIYALLISAADQSALDALIRKRIAEARLAEAEHWWSTLTRFEHAEMTQEGSIRLAELRAELERATAQPASDK